MSEHRVLFVIHSLTNVWSMLPAMLEIERQNIDVFVYELGAHKISHDEVADYLTSLGFTVHRKLPQNMKYDIVYTAYPWSNDEIAQTNQVKYRVRFYYGVSGANVPLETQAVFNSYDYLLCLSEPDAVIYSAHCKAVNIGNIKLANYKRSRVTPSDKKTVLYLPTWGGFNRAYSLNADTVDMLNKLKNKYNITAKMHGAVAHYESQRDLRDLFGAFDTVFDAQVPIADILNEADVVLSDLSSAAFDAIAGNVPLALFGLGESVYHGGKLCLHQQLVKDGIVPGTNDVNELGSIIENALTPECFAKQQQLKKEMFSYEGRECLDAFMRFQEDLFEDRAPSWYVASRRALREKYMEEQREVEEKLRENNLAHEEKLRENNLAYEEKLQQMNQAYEASSSWKLTAPIRALARLLGRATGK